jgi:hypothetical protein
MLLMIAKASAANRPIAWRNGGTAVMMTLGCSVRRFYRRNRAPGPLRRADARSIEKNQALSAGYRKRDRRHNRLCGLPH